MTTIPSDHTKLGEMEFYLLEDLEFNLTIFHPYQDLADLCTTQDADVLNDSSSALRTARGKLVLEEGAMQTAWSAHSCLIRLSYLTRYNYDAGLSLVTVSEQSCAFSILHISLLSLRST